MRINSGKLGKLKTKLGEKSFHTLWHSLLLAISVNFCVINKGQNFSSFISIYYNYRNSHKDLPTEQQPSQPRYYQTDTITVKGHCNICLCLTVALSDFTWHLK